MRPNAQNGSDHDKYNWGQTLSEVTVNVYLPPGTNAKGLSVNLMNKKCAVKLSATKESLFEGEWFKPINCEESLWCIETDGAGRKILQLSL